MDDPTVMSLGGSFRVLCSVVSAGRPPTDALNKYLATISNGQFEPLKIPYVEEPHKSMHRFWIISNFKGTQRIFSVNYLLGEANIL